MSYLRVIPRDLFNEAKLLKCLGQLALIIHDGVGVPRELALENEDPEEGFRIEQNQDSGALFCCNLECFFRSREIGLSCPYNNKGAFPLRYVLDDENEGPVFDDSGALSGEFIELLARLGAESATTGISA